MENTNNKPQWLIDAENAINEFENSKYGKMDTKEFNKKNQIEDWRQSGKIGINNFRKTNEFNKMQKELHKRALEKHPNMSSNGGKKRAESFDFNHQSKAGKSRTKEGMRKAGLIGGKAAGELRSKKTYENKMTMYSLIELNEFTYDDIKNLNLEKKLGVGYAAIKSWLNDTNFFIKIGKRKTERPGPGLDLYTKNETLL